MFRKSLNVNHLEVIGLLKTLIRNISSTSKLLAVVAESHNQDEAFYKPLDWDEAKPFSEIPGPKTFKSFMSFLPGGKYYDIPYRDLHKKLEEEYGELIVLKGFLGNVLITFNPKDFEQVYRTEGPWPHRQIYDSFLNYRKNIRPDVYGENSGVLAEQGEKWKELRGKMNPFMMQPRIAKQYIKPVEQVADQFITRMVSLRDSKYELPKNFSQELHKWSLETIARIALDSRLGCLDKSMSPDSKKMIQSVHVIFDLTYKLDILPSMWKYIRTPSYYKLINALETMTKISLNKVDEAMERLKMKETSEHEASVLEKLLKIDRNVAVITALDMLLAGVDASAHTTAILLYFLATNQRAQDKLREEILTILPEKNSKLSAESFNHIPYLRACMKEATRILPISGGIIRRTPVDLVLSGYQIPKGNDIILSHLTPSLKAQQFPGPDEYLPERWLSTQDNNVCPAKSAHPFAHMPFGYGPRSCVGKRFADLEIETLIAKLIRNYKIEWNYGELKMTSRILTIPISPLKYKVTEV